MGLAASQARLLSLTARMHDIEYKAQNLEAQKLQMANQSQQVYQEYEDALNKQKVQFKQIGADGSAVYKDASVQTLLDAGYQIKILNGSTWFDYRDIAGAGTFGTYEETPKALTVAQGKYNDAKEGNEIEEGGKLYKLAETPTNNATSIQVYEYVPGGGQLADIDLNSTEVLRNLVEAGFIIFEKPTLDTDENGNMIYTEVNIATDTNLQEVSDETELKKAEAKYEADMRKIDAKDKKFDVDIAALEQERNAIKTEMETLKTVAKDNVERTFKLFS